VIGDRQINVEHLGEGAEEALGLAQRKMKDHADRQRSLDRDVGVPSLTTGLPARWGPPSIECRIGEPDSQVTSVLQTGLVLGPIPYPIPRLRVLVLASLRILHRVWTPELGILFSTTLDQKPCTNTAAGA
jgi:hypothetical protein